MRVILIILITTMTNIISITDRGRIGIIRINVSTNIIITVRITTIATTTIVLV